MATSKKISELTTATVLSGAELIPLVQSGETVQAQLSLLSALAPVQSVNGLTGPVILAAGDLSGYNSDIASIISSITAVSIRVDDVSAALTSTQVYFEALISVATSGGLGEAPVDGQIYGRGGGNWVPVSITALAADVGTVANSLTSVNTAITSINNVLTSMGVSRRPYNVVFDFGVTTLPQGDYARVSPAGVTFYVLPSCSNSQIAFNTSAFPTAIVSIPIMYPTSVTLGILLIGVSGTATWPAIATTSVAPGETFGVQTSVSSDPTLTGLVISFAGYYNP